VLTNNVTVNLGVGYSALGTGIIGSTGSTRYEVATQDVIGALHAVGNSALDASAVLPTLTAGTFNDPTFGAVHGINMVRNGARAGNNGINLTTAQYDMTVTRNNARLAVTEANLKALGYTGFSTATNDANITFSSAFSFDFDPTNGIAAGQMDFIGVAIHEIGHALGFTSGVDLYDQYSGTGPGAATGNGVNWNNQTAGSVLDLFRYSTDPLNAAPGTGPVLDWSVGTASYFSLDGGLSQFNGGSLFSTGAYNGDGRQASHFKDTPSPAGCDGFNQIGIMDPTFCYGEMGVITVIDIAGFDAMGWNTSIDVMANLGYKTTTAAFVTSLLAPVPEPASWAMMLGGFGLVGFGIRRRKSMALTAWPLLPTDRLPCFGGTIDRQSLDGQAPLRSRSSSFSFTGRP
jgi:hypothetical protein